MSGMQSTTVSQLSHDRLPETMSTLWKRRVMIPAIEAKGWEIVASEATMYLWVVGPDPDALLDRGILVSPGEFFGPSGAGYVRFALVPTLDECERAAAILAEL